jgi:3-demethylubiquinone-9 3-methyltransferase
MDAFLGPIETPPGLMMRLAYYFTRRQFGKVLTPLKVHSARLPPAFGLFYTKIGKLDKKLTLPPETILLIRGQVARINALSLTVPTEAEAERRFAALAKGGEVQMPLTKTFFSPRFGMVADRFGVSWMIIVATAETKPS